MRVWLARISVFRQEVLVVLKMLSGKSEVSRILECPQVKQ